MHGYYGCGGESSRELFMRVNHLEELVEKAAKPRKRAPQSAPPAPYVAPAEEIAPATTPPPSYGMRVLEKEVPVSNPEQK